MTARLESAQETLGNICRSPMAEVLFINDLKRKEQDPAQWKVESAGTWTMDGYPASRNSWVVMNERGLDLSVLTPGLLQDPMR